MLCVKYSWLTTCIYIAILIVEYPTNWIIQRVPIAKYLGVNIVLWGTILVLHSVCVNFAGLVIVRTLLGIFEAACQPSFIVLSSMWYKREEQMARVTYWYMMNVCTIIPVLAMVWTDISPGCATDRGRPPSLLLHSPYIRPLKELASPVHYLRLCLRPLGPLRPLVDARLSHMGQMLL